MTGRDRDRSFDTPLPAAATFADGPADLDAPGWTWLIVGAAIVGLLVGALGTAFRSCLELAEHGRNAFIVAARGWPAGWIVVVVTSALAVGLASWMVRRFAPVAAGSGIPHAVAVIRGETLPTAARIIPVKFAGGWLAIGSGLALGREGPTVQMGATLALLVATRLGRLRAAWPALFAAGAGAGLTVAFDAPVAGMLFVFEEVLERFERRTVMATATACIVGVVFQRAILGAGRDFVVPTVPPPAMPSLVLFLLMGMVAGVLGALYNRLVLGFDRVTRRTASWPAGTKGAAVGAAVGVVAWFTPSSVGSGDQITQAILASRVAIATLPWLFLVRFALGPL
jgi:CIC family chloride channel protein